MKIGLFGGTFDPIHYGHLRMAEEARERIGLDRVIFVPNNVSPFKLKRMPSAGVARAEMLRVAIAGNDAFDVSTFEIDRPAPSYSVETLDEFTHRAAPTDSFYFLTGADAIRDLPRWREPERLLAMARFIAAARPGVTQAEITSALPERWRERIDFLQMPELDIAATDLRTRVREGRSIRYLTPPAVEKIIGDNGLYRNEATMRRVPEDRE